MKSGDHVKIVANGQNDWSNQLDGKIGIIVSVMRCDYWPTIYVVDIKDGPYFNEYQQKQWWCQRHHFIVHEGEEDLKQLTPVAGMVCNQ